MVPFFFGFLGFRVSWSGTFGFRVVRVKGFRAFLEFIVFRVWVFLNFGF